MPPNSRAGQRAQRDILGEAAPGVLAQCLLFGLLGVPAEGRLAYNQLFRWLLGCAMDAPIRNVTAPANTKTGSNC